MTGCDMIASLNKLPQIELDADIKLKRAFAGDKETILAFVAEFFSKSWAGEVEAAILHRKCYISAKDGKVCGFACYDSSAKGFFGPIGVDPALRSTGIGKALLIRTLEQMKADGYGYAIIGWVSDAEMFYRKVVNAEFIQGGEPQNSVYSNMVVM